MTRSCNSSKRTNLFVAVTKLLALMTLLCASVPTWAADANNIAKDMRDKEEAIASEMRRLLKCESLAVQETNLYCKLNYRGLSVEFAGANSRSGGSIYIHSLGAKQKLTTLGRRCIVVIFEDPNEMFLGPHILLRDDATFWSYASNRTARKGCA